MASLNTLSVLKDLGEDVSKAINIITSRLNECLKHITDKEVKEGILKTMKKALNNEEKLDINTSKSR